MAGKAIVNQDDCIACENCTQVCPEAFRIGEHGKSEFIDAGTGAECIQDAIDGCPMQCISWAE